MTNVGGALPRARTSVSSVHVAAAVFVLRHRRIVVALRLLRIRPVAQAAVPEATPS